MSHSFLNYRNVLKKNYTHTGHPVELSDDQTWSRNECGNTKRRRNETRQQWRVSGKRKRWKRERRGEGKRQEERNGGGENTDVALDVASLMITTATRLSQRRRSLPPSRSDDARRRVSRLIATINIKPTSRDRLFILWPPLLALRRLCGWWLTFRDKSIEILYLILCLI